MSAIARNQKNPLVSVIIPTYNDRANRLSRSIDSVITQTYENLEIIVVDDGSENPFGSCCSQDSRITWLELKQNQGVSAARNRGVNEATGEFVAFLDSGDLWHSEKIEHQLLDFFGRGDDLVMVFSGARFFDETTGASLVYMPPSKTDWEKELLIGQPIIGSSSSVLIRRKVFLEEGGFDEAIELPEDRDMWLRLTRQGEFSSVPECLVKIVVEAGSRSRDPEKKRIAYWNFIKKHEAVLKERGLYNDAVCSYHISLATKLYEKNQVFKGLKEAFEALRWGFRVHLILRTFVALVARGAGTDYLSLRSRVLSLRKRNR